MPETGNKITLQQTTAKSVNSDSVIPRKLQPEAGNEEQPKKRGRPKGWKKAKEEPTISKEIFFPFLNMYSSYVGKRKNKGWELTDDEREQFGICFANLSNKYIPLFANWQEELALIAVIGAYWVRCKYFNFEDIQAKTVTEQTTIQTPKPKRTKK